MTKTLHLEEYSCIHFEYISRTSHKNIINDFTNYLIILNFKGIHLGGRFLHLDPEN